MNTRSHAPALFGVPPQRTPRTRMLTVLGLVAGLLSTVALADEACELQAPASRTMAIGKLADGAALSSIPAGANTLYFMEVDAFWAAGNAQKSLQSAALRSLRFPGGELSDNYDWQKNRLVDPRGWPGEPAGENPAARTDYREFLVQARTLGVKDIYFVVNIDSAFRAAGDRDANLLFYAKKAAAWVKAVKQAGYTVPYWEIGNEPYIATGYPLLVAEYAQAVRVFAKEMRAADPSIRLGVGGPLPTDVVSFADRFNAQQLAFLRSAGGKRVFCGADVSNGTCVSSVMRAKPGAKGGNDLWWPTLVRLAGDSFDFAIVHRYASTKTDAGTEKTFVEFADGLRKLSDELSRQAGRRVPVSVTEWNSAVETQPAGDAQANHLFDVAIQYGNLLVAGVSHAHYWPMQEGNLRRHGLLDKSGQALPPVRLFALYEGIRPGDRVAHAVPKSGVYVLRYRRDAGAGHLLVNVNASPWRIRLAEAAASGAVSVDGLVAGSGGDIVNYKSCGARREGRDVLVPLPARSVIRIRQFRKE